MSAARQVLLLLWKNWKVSVRNKCATVFEIVIPVAFALLLLVIRVLVERSDIQTTKVWQDFSVNNLSNIASNLDSKTEIYYSPQTGKVVDIMNRVASEISGFGTVQGFSSEAAALDNYDVNPDTVWAIVAFDEIASYASVPNDVKYTLRVRRKSKDEEWRTENNFPFFQNPSYRNDELTGGTPYYYETGFLYIQYNVDKAIIDEVATGNSLESDTEIVLQKFAFPPHVRDLLLNVIQGTLPLFLILAFIVNVFQTTKNLAWEKEMKLKETMRLMGMNGNVYWLSWFLKALIYAIIICLIFTIVLHIKLGSKGAIFYYTHPTLTFLFLLLFCISVIAFCFLMSAMFAKANTAAYAAGILYFLLYVPFFFLDSQEYTKMSLSGKMGISLLNNMAMAYGVIVLTGYEGTAEGAQWNNFHKPPSIDDNFTLLYAMLMLIVDSIILALGAWYIGNIRPGDFGVPLPWYFPFTKVYWCGPEKEETLTNLHEDNTSSNTFENDPTGLNVGISIKNLRKVFGSGKHAKVAVAGTTMKMYEGQITVLLGHNGAGKTTTMSMLTGFLNPSSGTATISGCDLRKDLAGVRRCLGLCPQHDVLFANLTVKEHLIFYMKLKGVDSQKIESEVEDMLNTLKLQHKRNNLSTTLSGGQKRKLSVGISLVGDSKVIVLDEPTSGMDPSARRETWEILQSFRQGRTMLLTTHFMDEADLLGDRIAIMADGVIKCCGTSLFLKKAFGAGYHLVIVKTAQCNVEKVTSLIQRHVPSAVLESHISAELSYLLPFDESSKFEDLFEEIEKMSKELGLSSFGTSATTMEEVFLKVGEQAENQEKDYLLEDDCTSKAATAFDNPVIYENAPDINQFNIQEANGQRSDSTSDCYKRENTFEKNTGIKLSLQQIYALLVKKAIHTWRNRVITFVQLALPIIFVILALVTENNAGGITDEPDLKLDLSPFESPIAIYSDKDNTALTNSYTDAFKQSLSGVIQVDARTSDMSTFVVNKIAETSISQFYATYMIGAQFTTSKTVAFFNGEAFHTPAIALNFIMDAMLKKYTSSNARSISITNHPIPLSEADKSDSVTTRALALGFSVAFLTLFGMAFLTTSFIMFLIKERSNGAKHLQKVSGVSSFAYWISNFLWDIFNYLVPVLCIIIVFAAFNSPAYSGENRLGIVFLGFFVYGLCCLPFVYCLHYMFRVPSSGMTAVTMLNIITGLAALLTVFILEIPSLGTEGVASAIDWIATILFPHYCLGQTLNSLYVNYDTINTCVRANYEVNCQLLNTLPCCSGCTENCYKFEKNYLAWNKPGVARYITFMLLQFFAYSALVLLIEIGVVDLLLYKLKTKPSAIGSSNVDLSEEHLFGSEGKEVDSDVALEKKRLNMTAITSLMESDALIIKNLAKSYGYFKAVKKICVGVPQKECFGLLGQNGAGKTTTFKMLTGDVRISSGNAYLNSFDVKNHLQNVQQNLGYCPQFDALIDQMTGRETLTMYARLRGVPETAVKTTVNDLVDTLMLRKHVDKKTEAYSGGNKRKLSTAISLIGDPPFVLLDEPTTGMDPGARRQLWNVLSSVRASGRTLVLTSHSMEECDALCTKIAIMVNGEFVCLGSPQHLKNKFGHGYTLIVRTGTPGSESVHLEINLKNFIAEKFPNSKVFDSHQGYLHFQIPDKDVPLARVFGVMEQSKREINIEDYSVHQTTLEQVFLAFTRNQIYPEPTEKKRCCC